MSTLEATAPVTGATGAAATAGAANAAASAQAAQAAAMTEAFATQASQIVMHVVFSLILSEIGKT